MFSGDIGIEQVKTDPADVQFPNFRADFPIRESDTEMSRLLSPLAHFPDRQVMEILVQADGFLHAFLVDLLFEIAVPVEQSDRDEIQIEIAGRLAMIARRECRGRRSNSGSIRESQIPPRNRRPVF